MTDPITATLGLARESYGLVGGVIERWRRTKAAKVDAAALLRLLRLEARRNLAILEVTVGRHDALEVERLWDVAAVLNVEVLEAVLGQGETAIQAFQALRTLPVYEPEDTRDGADFLTSLYVRINTLQSLALLNAKGPLSWVRVDTRLGNLRQDTLALVKALASMPGD